MTGAGGDLHGQHASSSLDDALNRVEKINLRKWAIEEAQRALTRGPLPSPGDVFDFADQILDYVTSAGRRAK